MTIEEKNKLLEQLQNSDNWPNIFRPSFMGELNSFADEIFEKNTVEGMISSLLIYQQIVEKMVISLIEISQFYTRCQLINFNTKEVKLENKMFGQLLQELEKTPNISETTQFIKKCKMLNDIRIKIVHKISHKKSLKEIKEVSKISKPIFDEIYTLYDKIYDEWRHCLSQLKCDYSDFDIEEII